MADVAKTATVTEHNKIVARLVLFAVIKLVPLVIQAMHLGQIVERKVRRSNAVRIWQFRDHWKVIWCERIAAIPSKYPHEIKYTVVSKGHT